MSLVMTTRPALEPVTVSEAKAFLRLDTSDEDVLVGSLILTSRLHVEAALGLAIISQGWKVILDSWPEDGTVRFPLGPVLSVSAVRLIAATGSPTTLASDSYTLDGEARPPRLIPNTNWPAPTRKARGIEIDFTAGFGPQASDVPEPIRSALLLLVAHWYEHRDPLEIDLPETAIPPSVSSILSPYRTVRL